MCMRPLRAVNQPYKRPKLRAPIFAGNAVNVMVFPCPIDVEIIFREPLITKANLFEGLYDSSFAHSIPKPNLYLEGRNQVVEPSPQFGLCDGTHAFPYASAAITAWLLSGSLAIERDFARVHPTWNDRLAKNGQPFHSRVRSDHEPFERPSLSPHDPTRKKNHAAVMQMHLANTGSNLRHEYTFL